MGLYNILTKNNRILGSDKTNEKSFKPPSAVNRLKVNIWGTLVEAKDRFSQVCFGDSSWVSLWADKNLHVNISLSLLLSSLCLLSIPAPFPPLLHSRHIPLLSLLSSKGLLLPVTCFLSPCSLAGSLFLLL